MTIRSRPFKLREGTKVSEVVEVVTAAVTAMLADVPHDERFFRINTEESDDGTITLTAESYPAK